MLFVVYPVFFFRSRERPIVRGTFWGGSASPNPTGRGMIPLHPQLASTAFRGAGGVQGQRPCMPVFLFFFIHSSPNAPFDSRRQLIHDALMLPEHLKFTIHLGERIHLGVSGSIAAFKSLELLRNVRRA